MPPNLIRKRSEDDDLDYEDDEIKVIENSSRQAKKQIRSRMNNNLEPSFSSNRPNKARQSQQSIARTPLNTSNNAKGQIIKTTLLPVLEPIHEKKGSRSQDMKIQIKLGQDREYHYVFDAKTLVRFSTWFADRLSMRVSDHDRYLVINMANDPYAPVAACFELEWNDTWELWVLYRKQTTKPVPLSVSISRAHSADAKSFNLRSISRIHSVQLLGPSNTLVPEADKEMATELNNSIGSAADSLPMATVGCQGESAPKTNRLIPRSICKSYYNFFQLLHNNYPDITGDESQTLLNKLTDMIKLALYYETLSYHREYIRSKLLDTGRDLYMAIKNDAKVWLWYAFELQSPAIFKEAMIHLVGTGSRPWGYMPENTNRDVFRQIILLKSEALIKIETKIKIALFQDVIKANSSDIDSAEDKRGLRSWSIMNIWRDWFARAFSRLRHPSEAGTVYRTLAKGAGAYLPLEEVYAELKELHPKDYVEWDIADIAADLAKIKLYARKQVQELVVNYSVLNIEEAGISYLTCIKIEDGDIPW